MIYTPRKYINFVIFVIEDLKHYFSVNPMKGWLVQGNVLLFNVDLQASDSNNSVNLSKVYRPKIF